MTEINTKIWILPFFAVIGLVGCEKEDDGYSFFDDGPLIPYSEDPIPELRGNILISIASDEQDVVYRITDNGGIQIDIANEATDLSVLSISPDGFKYVVNNDYRAEIWDFTGNQLGSFYPHASWRDRYSWSQDSRYVYAGYYYNGIAEIDTVLLDYRYILESSSKTYDHSPAVSPDGRYLVWGHHEWGHYLDVYVADARELPTTYEDAKIIWSRDDSSHDEDPLCTFIDNERFVFTSQDEDYDSYLYVANARSGEVNRVLVLYDSIGSFRVSRDKQHIVITDDDDIYMINIRNWDAYKFETPKRYLGYNSDLAWSPDNKYFLLVGKGTVYEEGDFLGYWYADLYSIDGKRKWRIAERFESDIHWVNSVDWGP